MTLTGIYGGSFNPIHTGHIALARWLVENGCVVELWLMVSPQNPFKADATLMPDALRLRLARIAADGVPGVRVSDAEMHLPRPSYMWHTLTALRERHADREFALVIGADNWQRFPQWFHADDILSHHRVIIYPRQGTSIDAATLPKGVELVDAPLHDMSSTAIRNAMAHDPRYDGRGLDARVWQELRRCQSRIS